MERDQLVGKMKIEVVQVHRRPAGKDSKLRVPPNQIKSLRITKQSRLILEAAFFLELALHLPRHLTSRYCRPEDGGKMFLLE